MDNTYLAREFKLHIENTEKLYKAALEAKTPNDTRNLVFGTLNEIGKNAGFEIDVTDGLYNELLAIAYDTISELQEEAR